ncbi:hypothetical protein [Streptomyces beijiangensis]|uniref:Uncharacterized protein n=1 Tax=Streptomyces beijiangensis TaxID=163361 RepID=A0A939JLH9_9ACTN|nr:hypothetical protein [Streptomyces beijiangensis]MBO0516425.1 hypothetical protein [Streptomyces beijiangensis]
MPSMTTSKVSRWDQHGREHVVHVQKSGMQRALTCDTCGWRKATQFLPWLKAEEHLADAHQATVDPGAGTGAASGPGGR